MALKAAVSTKERENTARTPTAVWLVAGAACGLAFTAFILWGRNGAAYLVDLVGAYCF